MGYISLFNRLKETTTSDAIAFSPAMGFSKNRMGKRLDPKKKGKKLNMKTEVERLKEVKEDVDDKIVKTREGIIKELEKIVNRSKLGIQDFTKEFSVSSRTNATFLIDALRVKESLKSIERRLPDNIGDLELILSKLERKGNVANFDIFEDVKYLYGVHLNTKFQGINIIYIAYMDMNYKEVEMLYIKDVDILEEIRDEIKNVKVKGSVVYPIGGIFPRGFYSKVKEVIVDSDEDKEEDGDE
jgi:hypothetical protein